MICVQVDLPLADGGGVNYIQEMAVESATLRIVTPKHDSEAVISSSFGRKHIICGFHLWAWHEELYQLYHILWVKQKYINPFGNGLYHLYSWLVIWNIFYFSIQLGISSSQLTFIFFRGVGIPPTSHEFFSQMCLVFLKIPMDC